MTLKELEEDDGHKCVLNRMIPSGFFGFFIAPRSFIVTYYYAHEDDDVIFIVSSHGNKHLLTKHKALINDDVVAEIVVNYMKFSPKYDAEGTMIGTDIVHVLEIDAAGDLSESTKKSIALKNTHTMELFTEQIVKNRK